MDERRFDDLAKALGAAQPTTTRRRTFARVGLALGATVGLLGARRGAQAQTGGEPCNRVVCAADEFCCNQSCSICAPRGGFCTAQFCDDGNDGNDGGDFGEGAAVATTAPLNYRQAPGLGAAVLVVLPAGTAAAILDGPVAADGYDWYQLGLPGYGPDGATPGWAAGAFLTPA